MRNQRRGRRILGERKMRERPRRTAMCDGPRGPVYAADDRVGERVSLDTPYQARELRAPGRQGHVQESLAENASGRRPLRLQSPPEEVLSGWDLE